MALLDGLIASGAPEALVPEARRVRQVVLMHMPLGDRRERRSSRRPPRDRDHERMVPAEAGGAVRAAARAGARGRAGRRRRRSGAGERGRRPAALRRGRDPRQGARRAARRARGDGRSAVALRVRGLAGPRPGVGRRGAAPRERARPSGVAPGTAHGCRARPRVRERRPARARLARGDLRHGRHRGAGPRAARARDGRRRRERGARDAAGCWSRPATRRRSAPRCGAGSGTASCAGACAAPPASGARRCGRGRRPRPTSPALSPRRRARRT